MRSFVLERKIEGVGGALEREGVTPQLVSASLSQSSPLFRGERYTLERRPLRHLSAELLLSPCSGGKPQRSEAPLFKGVTPLHSSAQPNKAEGNAFPLERQPTTHHPRSHPCERRTASCQRSSLASRSSAGILGVNLAPTCHCAAISNSFSQKPTARPAR